MNIYWMLLVICWMMPATDGGSFNNNPGTVSIHENIDDAYTVWSSIDATCTVTDSCLTYTCQYYWGWGGWNGWAYQQFCRTVATYYSCSKNVQCNTCTVTSNNMFYASGKNIVKRECTDRGCGPTCSASYCMNSGDKHTIGVECWHSSYHLGYGNVATTFKVSVYANTAPSIWLHSGTSVSVNKDTHSTNSYVNRIRYSNPDSNIGYDFITYSVTDTSKFIAWDYSSRTDHLFYLNTGNGYLYVKKDLSSEYSYTYTGIELCIADRRDSGICTTLTITLTACYAIPSCYDQGRLTFSDQHGIGSTLFTFTYPSPPYHFPNFRGDWDQLQWTLVGSDLDVAAVDYLGGVLKTSGNITVWPYYPSRDYYADIRVGNSESCGRTTTCRMIFTVTFTNWPVRFVSLPDDMYKHENDDDTFQVHKVITYDQNPHAHDNWTCQMSFTPYEDNFFELRHDGRFSYDSWSIWRLPCQDSGCEYNCPLNVGCFTHDTTAGNKFVFTVTCEDFYGSDVTDTFTLNLIDNSPPYLTSANVDPVYISKDTHGQDSFVTRIYAADDDAYVDGDYIRWNITDDTKLIAWDYPNITRTDRLFYIDGLSGDIYVAADLSMQYSYVFRGIEVCIADRRDSWICRDLTIVMTACYEIPTCYDQEFLDFWDTHPVGDTLFNLRYPVPVYQFPVDFRSDWLDLTWSLDETDLDVAEVVQDETNGVNEGIMRTFANITVWPSWRYRDYYAIIRVSNAESCGRETTCVMTFRIWFKNWPIRFISLPDEMTKNEDFNDAFLAHTIITYDYNNPNYDNVTCEMSFVPHEDNLFELRHDGNNYYNSWSIHRLECQEKTCGFHCDKGIGCFTYNTTLNQQFVFTVHCWDAYDSDVTDTFTLHLDYNRAPVFHNLPLTITVDSDEVLDGDVLHTIQYGDNENENMHFNYSFSPNNGYWNDILIFNADQFGNYYDDQANITSTVYYHGMPASIYYIYICGTERRNMICETLTIRILDFCPAHPTCAGDSRSLSDTTTVGTSLFFINGQQDGSSGGTISYSFISPTPAFFQVDQASGEITVAKELTASFPSTTYQLTAFVYDSAACNYGSCQFTVTSTFTNYPISIDNLPFTYLDLPEDTELNEALIVIQTSDGNTDDTVTCSRVAITSTQTSDPIPQDLFRVTQTYSGSNVWFIENRELPGFTAAVLEYDILVNCHDKYDSSDQATLTVTIKPNETPTLDNLDASITVDPSLEGKDSIIYTVQTSDLENDELIFTWEVDDSFVPLALSDTGSVYLRRDVSIIDEDGLPYSIRICINDTLHNLQPEVCGTLTITFISSQKYPSISNLPDTVEFPEDTAGGTPIFDVDVYDENLDSVHTFSMTVNPSAAAGMFSLHAPTGVLTLQPTESFNFEEQETYTFTFAVKDQYLEGLEKKNLLLKITNVNEEPTIKITRDTLSFDEDVLPVELLAKSVATCSDIDKLDSHSFSIESSAYSTFFNMDPVTSELSVVQEWNLEDSMPTSATLNVICTDAGGLTSRKPISIIVKPVNEFDPVISPTSMSVSVNSETTVVDTLGVITSVSDDDFGDDGNFYYDIVGVGRGRKYFTMTQTGQLRLRQEIKLKRDKVFEFTISVSDEDYEPSARKAYCTVTANYTAPSEEIPEEPTYCTTCTTEGKLIMIAFGVEALILCIILAHIIHHVCTVCKEVGGVREVRPQRFKSLTNTTTAVNVSNSTIAGNAINANRPIGRNAINATRPVGRNVINATRPLGKVQANAGSNSTTMPISRPQERINVPQRNFNAPQINETNDTVGNSDISDVDESTSEDSDVDERLQNNQTFQPMNQPFPTGIDAAQVTGPAPTFGAFNYA